MDDFRISILLFAGFQDHMFGFKFVPKDQNERVTNTTVTPSCTIRDPPMMTFSVACKFGFKGKLEGLKNLSLLSLSLSFCLALI